MPYPKVKRGDVSKDVERFQGLLNRVGAMLIADGDFGGGTERGIRYAQDIANQPDTGLADEQLWQWLEKQPEPYPELATNGIAFIAAEETGGLAYYNAVTRWPHFPGYESGITIGVGYDLRFNSLAGFRQLWGNHLPNNALKELANDIGKPGSKERANELKQMGIEVPFKSAWPVFVSEILPPYYAETESIYPSLTRLSPLCRAVLVSVVFNRGSSLKGSSRREMRAIRDILAEADSYDIGSAKRQMILGGVEDQLVSMKRLWSKTSGLCKRRQAEANLWRKGLNAS